MYQISAEEYRILECIIKREMKSYLRTFKYDKDEFISMGNYAIGKACATFKPEKGASFKTYATTCIKNEFGTYYRKYKRKLSDLSLEFETPNDEGEELTLLDRLASPLTDYNNEVDRMDIQKALEKLREHSERDYILVTMTMEGYKQKEMALLVGINAKHISTHVFRAYDKLRKYLEVR